MNPAEQIALFDLDDSLADFTGGVFTRLLKLHSPFEPPITYDNLWDQYDKIPYIKERIHLIKNEHDFWLKLKPIDLGFQMLNICKQLGFTIQILTKGPRHHPHAWKEKVQWCQAYEQYGLGYDTNINVVNDKALFYGKILYDDYPDYMERWLKYRPRGLGIMPVNSYNKDFTHPNVIRWTGDREEAIAAIKSKFLI